MIEPDAIGSTVRSPATSGNARMFLEDGILLVYRAEAPRLGSARDFFVKKKKQSLSMAKIKRQSRRTTKSALKKKSRRL